MSVKGLTGLAVGVAMAVGASTAEATVVEPSPAVYLLPASPGLVVGAGALVTTVGTAMTLDDAEPRIGWAATAIVFGSLSVISGGVYTALAIEHDDDGPREVFGPTAATNLAFGVSSLALGIVAATAEPAVEPLPIVPMVSIDAGGRPFASVSGSF